MYKLSARWAASASSRKGQGVDVVIYAPRELHPAFPGIFDLALWDIGRKVCRPKEPRCVDCELRSLCAYGRTTT